MAVAVKNSPETGSSSLLDRLAVSSLVGALYVLGSIGVVFYLIPSLWATGDSFVSMALRVLAMLVAAGGLIVLGGYLAGSHPPHGLRAGVFVALVGLLLIGLITWGFGIVIENYLPGAVGVGLTLLIAAALLVLVGRWFVRPTVERTLIQFEDQGWFTAAAYKRSQGQRVRRGTILGLLILSGCGIYTLITHDTLRTAGSWELPIPFTQVTVESPGDSRLEAHTQVDKAQFRQTNDDLKNNYVKVIEPGGEAGEEGVEGEKAKLEKNRLVPKDEFKEKLDQLKELKQKLPISTTPTLATGHVPSLVLLPDVKFTLPLLLALGALWLSYRVVNYPVFADFLIATEAELNKVSWTTRKRLVQDTIVVLVTVFLLTAFLFVVDLVWGGVLSWKPIGVLMKPDQTKTGQVDEDEKIPY